MTTGGVGARRGMVLGLVIVLPLTVAPVAPVACPASPRYLPSWSLSDWNAPESVIVALAALFSIRSAFCRIAR